jgi:hypothetical protein
MRRILLSCALLALFVLPATAGASASAKAGYLVVKKASGDGGVNGPPVATVVVKGFVLGRVSQPARVDIFQLSANGQGVPQVKGADMSTSSIEWHGLKGTRYRGRDLRFRATGGSYRIVVRGSGIYLFAGGKGLVRLRGSRFNPNQDGRYAVNGGTFRSLPKQLTTWKFG